MTRNPYLPQARVAAAVSNEIDRAILASCMCEAKPVRAIEAATGVAQATVYRRINALLSDGLLVVERSAISVAGKRYDLYRSRLRSVRLELDTDGIHVQWESVEGVEERLQNAWLTSVPA